MGCFKSLGLSSLCIVLADSFRCARARGDNRKTRGSLVTKRHAYFLYTSPRIRYFTCTSTFLCQLLKYAGSAWQLSSRSKSTVVALFDNMMFITALVLAGVVAASELEDRAAKVTTTTAACAAYPSVYSALLSYSAVSSFCSTFLPITTANTTITAVVATASVYIEFNSAS